MTPIRYLPPPRWIGIVLLIALSLLAGLRSAAGTRLDSFTVDEPWHVVAGTAYVRGEGFHLNPEHPPLVKLWVGAWMPDTFRLPPMPDLHDSKRAAAIATRPTNAAPVTVACSTGSRPVRARWPQKAAAPVAGRDAAQAHR